MIELFVEGYQVDINQGFSTMLTYAIDDIKDFGAKNSTFSKTIILPGTKNNNVIFGNIFNINQSNEYNLALKNVNINFNASVSAKAVIFADNLQIFKGIFRVMEIIVDDGFIEYEAAVFGEMAGFVTALANKKIEDLDFSTYNLTYNYTNIVNSWNSITGSGVYFPLIDYGATSTNKVDFDFRTFKPALYVKEYLEKIISASGYTWDFPLLSSALFETLHIPNNQQQLYTTASATAFDADATAATYTSISNARYTISTLGSFTASINNDVFTFTPATSLNTNIYCYYSGQINSVTSAPTSVTFYLKKNSTILSQVTISVPSVPRPFGVNLSVNNVTFNTSDQIKLEIQSNVVQIQQYGGAFTITATTPARIPVSYGDTINVNDTIPKGIFQKDFFSSICKMFNLYVFEDYETDKKIKVVPFVDFYADATAVDWSNKIDRSKPMKMKPMAELNARYYQYKFKTDNDFYSENYRKKFNLGYGDFNYDSEYEFSKDIIFIELIFAQSVLYQKTGTDKIYPAIYKLSNNNTTEDQIDSIIRIMQAKKITGITSWDIKNGGTTLVSSTDYGYSGHLDSPSSAVFDLNFAAPSELIPTYSGVYPSSNLFNTYWAAYLAEITDKDSRLLTCSIKLDYKDIYKIDFSKLIWIDGGLYRINKIIDFNASNEDTCTIELLKIINRIY
jgi:hypothetical protein